MNNFWKKYKKFFEEEDELGKISGQYDPAWIFLPILIPLVIIAILIACLK